MKRLVFLLFLCFLVPFARANTAENTVLLTVDGVERTALVYVPPEAKAKAAPLVFVFHGHGGNSQAAANKFAFDRLCPEAISVYPQGLNTPGTLTDREGLRAGWQKSAGDQSDRDLHFVDALLARLESDCKVDPKRIYCAGHSNGGAFTYLLWRTRPQIFAAFAPCSAAANYALQLTAKPAIISAGRNDPLVKFEWQERTMDAVRKLNGCEAVGQPWQSGATIYSSKGGTPRVTYIYNGGHAMDTAEPKLIVKFFQEN